MQGFQPTRFEWTASVEEYNPHMTITIESRDGYEGRKWCIKQGSNCLGKDGHWEYEAQPSSRTDEFKERCRWDTPEQAADFLLHGTYHPGYTSLHPKKG